LEKKKKNENHTASRNPNRPVAMKMRGTRGDNPKEKRKKRKKSKRKKKDKKDL